MRAPLPVDLLAQVLLWFPEVQEDQGGPAFLVDPECQLYPLKKSNQKTNASNLWKQIYFCCVFFQTLTDEPRAPGVPSDPAAP